MKTTFILHGGFTPGETSVNDAFFSEVLKNAPSEPHVLLVYFAKEADRVDKNRNEDVEQFNQNRGGRMPRFETASEEDFPEQVKRADVVYLHGGQTGRILEILKKYPGLKEIVKGKIIAGDSAGANVLATVFYSKSLGAADGLGILPLKLICHFRDGLEDMLLAERPELETVFLAEYQFKVITKSE